MVDRAYHYTLRSSVFHITKGAEKRRLAKEDKRVSGLEDEKVRGEKEQKVRGSEGKKVRNRNNLAQRRTHEKWSQDKILRYREIDFF
jgi:hypothetical protein